jgi:hypothetical protein
MEKNQIYRIIVGLFLVPLGIYLSFLRVDYIISSSVTLLGTTLVIIGFRYKERMKHQGLKGEALQSYLKSTFFVVAMVGTVFLFIGLGGVALAVYFNVNIYPTSKILWLFVIFVGMIVLFIARAFRGKAFRAIDKLEEHHR